MSPRGRRLVAPLLGVSLIAAAAWSVARHGHAATAAWEALRAPFPAWALALPAAVLATFGLTSFSLQWLTNRAARESRIGFSEMLALTFASTLVAVQSTALTAVAVAWLGLALVLVHAGGLSWMAAPASLLLLLPALLDPARRGSALAPALGVRGLEVLCSALRTMAAFALIGRPIDPAAALTLACAANAANCVPLVGNGLGIREWVTGLLAPAVAGIATPDALAAELLNRAVELTVVVPGGLVAAAPLARRLAEAMRTRRVEPRQAAAPFAGAASVRWSFSAGRLQPPPDDPSEPPPSTPISPAP